MLKQLKNMVKKKQKEEFDSMFNARRAIKSNSKTSAKRTLIGLVEKRTPLFRKYKGIEHEAY